MHVYGNIGEMQMIVDGGVIFVDRTMLRAISDAASVINTLVVSAWNHIQ